MKKTSSKNNIYLILILGLLTAIGPFSIDMYLPAFPDIAKDLNTTVAQVMLSLSSFFIGISIGQFIYGPLLERFGRKKPLYTGLCLYLVATICCAMATTVNELILFRFVQALGSCAGLVAARAIVRDLFEVKQNARIFSTLILVVAVSPIIAPTLGGYVSTLLDWRYVFGVLMILVLIIILGVYYLLPESKTPDPTFSLKPIAIIKNYLGVLKHPQFYTYAVAGAVAYGGLCAYVSGSPNVFMEIFHVSEKHYGWIFAIIALGIIIASQLNTFLLRKNSSEQIIKVALFFQCLIGLTFVALTFFGLNEIYSTMLLIFLFMGCQGFIFPNASALSMACFGHNAGSASALMGGIQMGVGASASAIVSLLQNQTTWPMAGIMASCSITALCILFWGRKIIVMRARLAAVVEEDVEMISTI